MRLVRFSSHVGLKHAQAYNKQHWYLVEIETRLLHTACSYVFRGQNTWNLGGGNEVAKAMNIFFPSKKPLISSPHHLPAARSHKYIMNYSTLVGV